jgi:hypothetical protein
MGASTKDEICTCVYCSLCDTLYIATVFGSIDKSFLSARLNELTREIKKQPLPAWPEVEARLMARDAPYGSRAQATFLAQGVVLFLSKDRGDFWVSQILQHVEAGIAFDAAYAQASGETPEQAFQRFLASF